MLQLDYGRSALSGLDKARNIFPANQSKIANISMEEIQ